MTKEIRIKLPKPFRRIIDNAFRFKGFKIIEAYVDEREYPINTNSGLKKLRIFLKIQDDESVCDCYCKVVIGGGQPKHIIFEHTSSKHNKSISDAEKQLRCTAKLLKDVHDININYPVACRVPMDALLRTKRIPDCPFEVVYSTWSQKPINLEGTNIPLMWV